MRKKPSGCFFSGRMSAIRCQETGKCQSTWKQASVKACAHCHSVTKIDVTKRKLFLKRDDSPLPNLTNTHESVFLQRLPQNISNRSHVVELVTPKASFCCVKPLHFSEFLFLNIYEYPAPPNETVQSPDDLSQAIYPQGPESPPIEYHCNSCTVQTVRACTLGVAFGSENSAAANLDERRLMV